MNLSPQVATAKIFDAIKQRTNKTGSGFSSETLPEHSIGRRSISTCQAGGPERASKIIALQPFAFNDCPLSFLIWPRARASKRATSQTRLGILRGTILVPSLWFGVVPRLVRVAIISDDVGHSRQTCQNDALHKRMQSVTPLSTDPM